MYQQQVVCPAHEVKIDGQNIGVINKEE